MFGLHKGTQARHLLLIQRNIAYKLKETYLNYILGVYFKPRVNSKTRKTNKCKMRGTCRVFVNRETSVHPTFSIFSLPLSLCLHCYPIFFVQLLQFQFHIYFVHFPNLSLLVYLFTLSVFLLILITNTIYHHFP